MIIDNHDDYTTAARAREQWRKRQIAGIEASAVMPAAADLKISDDALTENVRSKVGLPEHKLVRLHWPEES